jgi:rfaE bifunctional protein kinase chain/domain/rfaE bifunctional protein nucleotidyltransferase chain/domain
MKYLDKIKPRTELSRIVEKAKREGKTVVQCHGCFDILHPGHLRHLTWAKQQGDLLVVSVSADSVVQKGFARPFVPEKLRAENLAALEVVDYVTIDDGEWAGPILEALKPNIYVKGKEFQDVYDGRFGRERQLVEAYGGTVKFSSGEVVYSSTKIIEDFKDRLEPVREQVHAFCKRHKITEKRLREIVEIFPTKKILVVGDTIVDRYVYCDRLGMSADAPVLVVRPRENDTFLGGAGIVAQHVKSFGGQVKFLSVIGNDPSGRFAAEELKTRGVPADLVVDSSRPTTFKTRYLSDGKKLLNVNEFRDQNLDAPVAAQLREKIEACGEETDAIAICDFSYGVISPPILDALCEVARARNIPIIGDVQSSSQMGNVARLKGITMATPSEREARIALCDRESGVADLGAMLLSQTGNRSLVVTLADRGVMIFDTEGRPLKDEARSLHLHEIKRRIVTEYLPSFATFVADPMGAGDAMSAAIVSALAAGGGIMESVYLGNCAAAVEVRKMGNIPISKQELLESVHAQMQE